MLKALLSGAKPAVKTNGASVVAASMIKRNGDRKATYSKVFRYNPAAAHEKQPAQVEVVGSFTNWQPIPLARNPQDATWHVSVDSIEGNKTHHYMLLVDGKPHVDKLCDGYVAPHGEIESRYAITTARGPRLFLLFAQTK